MVRHTVFIGVSMSDMVLDELQGVWACRAQCCKKRETKFSKGCTGVTIH
jgi:hypothetical protein